MLPHKTMRLAILACAYSLIVEAADIANSPSIVVPKRASDSAAPKSPSGSASNTARLAQPSPLFQPITTSKPLRILGFFPYNGYSHFIMFKPIMSGLAKRGHHVTVVSPFPLQTPEKNYHDVDLSDIFPKLLHNSTFSDRVRGFDSNLYHRLKIMVDLGGAHQCNKTFSHPEVKALLSANQKFDVIFTEVFGTDCYLALGHVLKAPVINVVTSNTIHWMHDYMGDVTHPAIVPGHYNPKSFRDLSYFSDRFCNVLVQIAAKILYYFLSTIPSEKVIRETFGDSVPSLEELRYRVSLVMVNSHPTIFGAKPTVPRILPIGGVHLQSDRQEVPEDIKLWLDTAPQGVLLFSLGSLVIPESIPPPLIKAFVSAFYELRPLRILWKYKPANNSAEPIFLPDNIKLVDWVPQQEVLSHVNTVAFMTHGGLMGLFEGIYYGVPMIGIPLFADQLLNVLRLQKIGCARHLDHATLTKADIVDAVLQATTNSTVRQRVKEVSRQFRDRPMSPLDSAIWWTEYIARHGGAPHLESPTARMPFWQYALLDVIATALAIAILILYFVYFVISRIWRFRRRSTPLTSPPIENKKQN